MNTLRSLLSDIIEVIDTLESLKAKPRQDSNQYVPKPAGYYIGVDGEWTRAEIGSPPADAQVNPEYYTPQSEFAQKVAKVLESANLGEVTAVSEQTEKEQDSDPEENAHQAAMFTPEAENEIAAAAAELSAFPEPAPTPEPEKKPVRKPRTPKAPKPEPVDIGAVRQDVAEVISVMVTEGKKDIIKYILATYGVDRARELPDDKVENFLNDLRTPL
jgi:hypothetical protein